MKFEELLSWVGDEPVFETGLLLAGDVDPLDVRKQLSRWVKMGRLYQLRRGLYALAPPYRKVIPHPFLAANRLQPGSYVSLQSALAHYGLIPEAVPTVTSISTGRPEILRTPLGTFAYRHVQTSWLHTYHHVDLGSGQSAFIATPEKALLDLVYLEPGADLPEYLRTLRLQALEGLEIEALWQLAREAGKPKLRRAVEQIESLAEEEMDFEVL
jgi:hypothetical protein